MLFSALLHASWNALAKSSTTRVASFVLMALATGFCGLLAVPFVPLPPPETWVWLGASVVLHAVYFSALIAAYDVGDLSLVYPISRGLAFGGWLSTAAA